jgi:hypothetical protein
MAVDQAGQKQHPRAVDDLGVVGGDARRDRSNMIRLDQDVALRQIANRGVHADDGRAFDQLTTHDFSLLRPSRQHCARTSSRMDRGSRATRQPLGSYAELRGEIGKRDDRNRRGKERTIGALRANLLVVGGKPGADDLGLEFGRGGIATAERKAGAGFERHCLSMDLLDARCHAVKATPHG